MASRGLRHFARHIAAPTDSTPPVNRRQEFYRSNFSQRMAVLMFLDKALAFGCVAGLGGLCIVSPTSTNPLSTAADLLTRGVVRRTRTSSLNTPCARSRARHDCILRCFGMTDGRDLRCTARGSPGPKPIAALCTPPNNPPSCSRSASSSRRTAPRVTWSRRSDRMTRSPRRYDATAAVPRRCGDAHKTSTARSVLTLGPQLPEPALGPA